MPDRVRDLVSSGNKDDKSIAKALGVSANTMWAWTKKHVEFAKALTSVYQNPPKRDVKAAERENQVRDLLARLRSHRRPADNKPTDAGAEDVS
jgi:transposase